ncbi:TetR/AcrR family transcriptional regulator [Vibrio panuliri]|uniref:TetR family transcriptional regulator n=1 Tax=Vibrio panuliri TaxID=1381081 RepID=A0A1Q9HNW4_9VIBR|nr:TetR/AcrR family transcriptional regulator [Vibrio panuliri]KAB1460447.1 TetR/AcrR family transcriptional regulator [Vibrio panuliri]OLQ92272.1 TetR family transcriptional regulator [Vibrio panuliri]OLQ92503.1 TetR family transcriptional regulator [Vibrio panuliri]
MNKPSVDKRQQILEAAETVIAESGFHGLSMQKVAKQASVAAGTIYCYFSDKEHLLAEVRLNVTQRIADAVQAGIEGDEPLKDRYRIMWLNTWNLALSNKNALSNQVQYDSLPCNTDIEIRAQERQKFHQVHKLFEDGKAQGLFKPIANEVLSGLTFEACVALARKHAWGFYQLDDDAIEAAINASWDAVINH